MRLLFLLLLAITGVSARASADPLQDLLTDIRVPGLAMAEVREGVVTLRQAGVANAESGTPVDAHTIFEAASLSKPLFFYAVLKLVDAGRLSLDARLADTVPDFIADPQAAAVTVRSVLSQSSGLPNLRSKDAPFRLYFPPGQRFSYSGEATIWLQRVVETITGEPLDTALQRLVFAPLGMTESSFVWQPGFETDYAWPHDGDIHVGKKSRPTRARAASTLHTTAADYARFLQAVLEGRGLRPETARAWLTPQVAVDRRCIECLSGDAKALDAPLAWGLGWGLEPREGTFFQWGDNGRFKAFAMGSVAQRRAVVLLTNGTNGMSAAPALVRSVLRGPHPAFDWLGQFGYDVSK